MMENSVNNPRFLHITTILLYPDNIEYPQGKEEFIGLYFSDFVIFCILFLSQESVFLMAASYLPFAVAI